MFLPDIVRAISNWQLIVFTYHGLERVVEPHVYGSARGTDQILAYQVDGESGSGDLPGWRRFKVPGIEDLEILEERFPGPRENDEPEHFAQVFMRVEARPRVRQSLLELVPKQT